VNPSPVIPTRFRVEVDRHLVLNYVDDPDWPLVLGIFGPPGDGKSFQLRAHLNDRNVGVVSINAADLESDRAGLPGKLVLAKYTEAGEKTARGVPTVLLVDDFDTTVGEWTLNTGTVNHQQILAQLMHLADSPTVTADSMQRRVPVVVTGNDLGKIYPPLRRPGRMRPFVWQPTAGERQLIVSAILSELADDETVAGLLKECNGAPISFFAELRTEVIARSAGAYLDELAGKLVAVVRDPSRHARYINAEIKNLRPSAKEMSGLARELWALSKAARLSYLGV
jgi:SpoVK/Ycf46/Vps4 family AAA+-type ATPase